MILLTHQTIPPVLGNFHKTVENIEDKRPENVIMVWILVCLWTELFDTTWKYFLITTRDCGVFQFMTIGTIKNAIHIRWIVRKENLVFHSKYERNWNKHTSLTRTLTNAIWSKIHWIQGKIHLILISIYLRTCCTNMIYWSELLTNIHSMQDRLDARYMFVHAPRWYIICRYIQSLIKLVWVFLNVFCLF